MTRQLQSLAWALAILLLASPVYGQATAWQIDPEHTSAQFAVRHMSVSTVRGRFNTTTGTVTWDGQDLSAASVEMIIDAASIDTGVKKRDDHLRSADFLNVVKYPSMTFKSTKIEAGGPGKVRMTGTLTIRGVTKPVVFEVTGPSPIVRDPDGGTRVGASAVGKINRKEFGLVWNRFLEAGGAVVGMDVAITIDIEIVNRGGGTAK